MSFFVLPLFCQFQCPSNVINHNNNDFINVTLPVHLPIFHLSICHFAGFSIACCWLANRKYDVAVKMKIKIKIKKWTSIILWIWCNNSMKCNTTELMNWYWRLRKCDRHVIICAHKWTEFLMQRPTDAIAYNRMKLKLKIDTKCHE